MGFLLFVILVKREIIINLLQNISHKSDIKPNDTL